MIKQQSNTQYAPDEVNEYGEYIKIGGSPVPGLTLRHILRGHERNITRIAWSPNGRFLASPSYDETIRIWDRLQEECTTVLTGHEDKVWSVAWSQNSERLASVSRDQTLRLWDVKTERTIFSDRGNNNEFLTVAFSPDGQYLADADSQEIRIRDAKPRKVLQQFKPKIGNIIRIAWSPNGQLIALCPGGIQEQNQKQIIILDAEISNIITKLDVKSFVSSAVWHPNGEIFVNSQDDGSIQIWNTTSWNLTHVIESHANGLESLSFSFDGKLLASKSRDGYFHLWSCIDWSNLAILAEASNAFWINDLAFNPSAHILATLGERNTAIRIWEIDIDLLLGQVSPKSTHISHSRANFMTNQTNQHRQEVQEPLDIINQRIAALRKDIALTLDSEKKVILKNRLKEAFDDRDIILTQLNALESQPSDQLFLTEDKAKNDNLMVENYVDFDLHIAPNGYAVATSIEGEEKAEISLKMPKNIKLSLKLIERNETDADLLKDVGEIFYDWLFPSPIHTHFHQTEAVARRENKKIRLRLRVEAEDIARLPLEFIYRQAMGYFVAINPNTVLSRYLNLPLPPGRVRRRQGPLHMLLIIANPTDQTRLPPDEWETLIKEALTNPLESGQITLQTVKRATRKEIRNALLKQKPDIIQFVGHGIYKNGKGYLALVNDKTDRTWLVDDENFANLYLGYDDNLGLISLATCESAKSDDPQGFVGIAPKLVQRGVPAVLSMQYKVLIQTAKIFLEDFYTAVAAQKPIDWAAQSARNAVSQELGLNNREFATPVLYMRAKDGEVF